MEISSFKIPIIGSRGLIAQGIVGLVALFLFMINSVSAEKFLPEPMYWSAFVYVLFSLSTMITLGIQQNIKTAVDGEKCHYCQGAIEISSYKCKACGKEQ